MFVAEFAVQKASSEKLKGVHRQCSLVIDMTSKLMKELNRQQTIKRLRTSLFASYDRRRSQQNHESSATMPLPTTIMNYIDTVGAVVHSTTFDRWATVRQQQQFKARSSFLERSLFAVPATSAPVERVFSYDGLFMRPHRARVSDQLLSDLVFIKCNIKLNCRHAKMLKLRSELKS